MRWHLIRHELLLIRRSIAAAALVNWLLILLMLGKADTFVGNAEMLELLETMPTGLLQAFGITPASFMTFEGYLASQPYGFYILALGMFAAVWAFTGIVKEQDRGTSEYLFTLPHPRGRIYLSKAAAHWLAVTFLYVTTTGLTLLFGELTTGIDQPEGVFALMTAGYTVCLMFMGIGYGMMAAARHERGASAAAVGIVTGSFILTLLNGAGDSLRSIAEWSPFRLYDPELVMTAGLTLPGLTVTLGVYAAGLALGLWMLYRRDLG